MQQHELLQRLTQLVDRLYRETEGFADQPEAEQLWYNRGYANGIVACLQARSYPIELARDLVLDDDLQMTQFAVFRWGQAYRHGFELGEQETEQAFAHFNLTL